MSTSLTNNTESGIDDQDLGRDTADQFVRKYANWCSINKGIVDAAVHQEALERFRGMPSKRIAQIVEVATKTLEQRRH